jgi:NADH:ubiquinone oxidoreductase subunit C
VRTQLNKLESAFGGSVQVRNFGRSDRFVVEVDFGAFVEVAAWLRMEETFRMDFLEALTVFEAKGKFALSYFIRSQSQDHQLVLRTNVTVPGSRETAKVPSMIGVWSHAEPFESELAPLFGIEFTGARAPGAVRKNFGAYAGFPLRKSFAWQEDIAP